MKHVLVILALMTSPAEGKPWHLSAFFDSGWGRHHTLAPRHVIRVFVLEAKKMRKLG